MHAFTVPGFALLFYNNNALLITIRLSRGADAFEVLAQKSPAIYLVGGQSPGTIYLLTEHITRARPVNAPGRSPGTAPRRDKTQRS